MTIESLDHDAILPTEKVWIILSDGIANFTIGDDHYELFVKDRVRGNINVSFRYNFGNGYFELYRLSATGKDLFTISKISKVVHEVIYDVDGYKSRLPFIKQNPIKSESDLASNIIKGVKLEIPNNLICDVVESNFDPLIEDEVTIARLLDMFIIDERLLRSEITRMRSFY